MKIFLGETMRIRSLAIAVLALAAVVAVAQNPQVEQKLMAIKQNMAKNKQQAGAVHLDGNRNYQPEGRSERHQDLSGADGEWQAAEDRGRRPESTVRRRPRWPFEAACCARRRKMNSGVWAVNRALAKQYTTPESRSSDAGQAAGQRIAGTRKRHHRPGNQEFREA